MNMPSNVELVQMARLAALTRDDCLVDVVGIVLGFLQVDGDRVRHDLSDVDLAEAMTAVGAARHPWRATRVRIREARGSRANYPAPASQGYRDTEHVRDYYRTTKI